MDIRKMINMVQNLNENTTTDFNNWFNGSKVINENGKPLVVYHGSNDDFDTFKPEKMSWQNVLTQQGPGFYFTNNKKEASSYGKPKEFYLAIKNPFILSKTKGRQITKNQAIELFSNGTKEYFFNEWIPFYTNNNTISKEDIKNLPVDKRIELYVNKLINIGDAEILQNLKRAYTEDSYGQMLNNLSQVLKRDGLIYKHSEKTTVFVAWNSNQIKRA